MKSKEHERPDADDISAALEAFRKKAKPPKDWWCKFAYHYTDIINAAKILETGVLYCRKQARTHGLMVNDNADQDVISHSQGSHDWVRLYFRPMTPTQYRNEGIQPASARTSGHCPVPVFFVFDLERVLRRKGTRFTDSGMNKRNQPTIYHTPAELQKMPARDIYSFGSYNRQTEGHLKDRRHAEILIHGEFPIQGYLWRVVCRSSAERETLLGLLSRETSKAHEASIRATNRAYLFQRRWPYVETFDIRPNLVELGKRFTKLTFRFWPESNQPGQFTYRLEVLDSDTNRTFSASGIYDYHDSKDLGFRIPSTVRHFTATLFLDDCLAYKGYRSTDSIFDF